jgi:group I intron endonuclease
MGYIYRITNTINKKVYIGQTIQETVEKRWELHRRLAKKDKGCTALKEAFKKYGIDKFKFEVLIICFNEDCIAYEKEYIKKYNALVPNGYNISEGGNGGALFKGKQHTEETKNKLRETSKAYYNNPENRKKHSDTVKVGLEKSEKWQKALAEGRVGENLKKENRVEWIRHTGHKPIMSEEVKKKLSENAHKYYEENREKHNILMSEKLGHQINQYDLNDNYIKTYMSIREAVRQTNIPRTSIQYCILGKLKTAGSFIWKRSENTT